MGVARGTFLSGLHGLLGISTTGCLRGSFWIWAIDGQTMSNMGESMGIFEVIWSYLRLLYVTIVLIVLILWKLYRLYHLIWHIIYWTMEALLRWLQKVGWTMMDPRKKAFPDFVTWSLTNFLEGRPEKLLEYNINTALTGYGWMMLDVFMMYSAWKQGLSSTCWSDYTIAPLVWRT